jgi:pyoverdine/dityrosine biosynthesis protein Dit1
MAPKRGNPRMVDEIYIDFETYEGYIRVGSDDVSEYDVAAALELLAKNIRISAAYGKLAYVDLDEGKFFCGAPERG